MAADDPIDPHFALPYKIVWPKCDLNDFSKLTIKDGMIHYKLYRQDGTLQPMTLPDNQENRLYVSWFQIHDRYTNGEADHGK